MIYLNLFISKYYSFFSSTYCLESVWILTRERLPPGQVLQTAYGILDKYRISRTFFVKTDQSNCETVADAEEAEDVPDSGYDIVVDDDTVSHELLNNHGYDNPQVNQVQHIAHVQNLQQFSPYLPVNPVTVPHIHHVHGVGYYKQNEAPSEKSVLGTVNTTEAETKIEKTTEQMAEATKLPTPMAEVLALNVTEKLKERK